MRKVKAVNAAGNRVVCEYEPLTEPALAGKYAELLSNGFNSVVVHSIGSRIEVVARNVHKVGRNA